MQPPRPRRATLTCGSWIWLPRAEPPGPGLGRKQVLELPAPGEQQHSYPHPGQAWEGAQVPAGVGAAPPTGSSVKAVLPIQLRPGAGPRGLEVTEGGS